MERTRGRCRLHRVTSHASDTTPCGRSVIGSYRRFTAARRPPAAARRCLSGAQRLGGVVGGGGQVGEDLEQPPYPERGEHPVDMRPMRRRPHLPRAARSAAVRRRNASAGGRRSAHPPRWSRRSARRPDRAPRCAAPRRPRRGPSAVPRATRSGPSRPRPSPPPSRLARPGSPARDRTSPRCRVQLRHHNDPMPVPSCNSAIFRSHPDNRPTEPIT